MLLRTLTLAALLVALLSTSTATQNASSIVAGASKAMGVDSLNSITYSGTARNGAFGQSKAIGEPMGAVNVTRITEYTRTIKRTSRFHAHDEGNTAKVGDRVRIEETRPLSKLKRWRLREVLVKAQA